MTPTAARPRTSDSSHWYYADGKPCYELPKADGKGMKVPTLADARKLNLTPSVTTILKVLAKPALQNWIIEQAILAVLTSPRKPGETDDAFVDRIINVEMVQDQERDAAAKRGTAIHTALELLFTGQGDKVDPHIMPWVNPAYAAICKSGELVASELCLAGGDFAGRTDLVLRAPDTWRVWDWKSCKKMPDPKQGAWPEHRLQLSAYGRAWLDKLPEHERCRKVSVGNVYISTVVMGAFVICETSDWFETYERGFRPLVDYWQWSTRYKPTKELLPAPVPVV